MFQKYDQDKSGFIDFAEFKHLVDDIRGHNDITAVFDKYKDTESNLMGVKELMNFLKIEQGWMDITHHECGMIIDKVVQPEPRGEPDYESGLSKGDFMEFLHSKALNNILDHALTSKEQDMDKNLSCYLSFSSHNTYLSGHQLKGDSLADMYR